MRRKGGRRASVGLSTIRNRMIAAFAVIVVLFSILGFRIGYIQVVATDIYASKAAESQIKDEIIPARRGDILDRNMKELAVSTDSYTIYLRLKPYAGDTMKDAERQEQLSYAAQLLSQALGMDKADIDEKMKTTNSRARIARDVTKDQMAIIDQGIEDRKLKVIEVDEHSSRQYPMGAFAAHVIGTVNNDGHGQSGVEMEYDHYLSGISGRRIMNADGKGNPISGGANTNYDKQDGMNVVTTIDETVQYHVEEVIKQTYKDVKPDKVEAIVMDPNNGDVLAMATYPEYDLNSPYKPVGKKAQATFEAMSDAEQSEYLSAMWRNPIISDLYEPGSVFKLITVSSALETGAVRPEDNFECRGVYTVEDQQLHCH
ncbi:MAG: hypothetical protein LBL63_05050, partial [Clostridiales Family XIII bacterium]|nr:hypothetical protein [Clostridiales Family XIII bacterium]